MGNDFHSALTDFSDKQLHNLRKKIKPDVASDPEVAYKLQKRIQRFHAILWLLYDSEIYTTKKLRKYGDKYVSVKDQLRSLLSHQTQIDLLHEAEKDLGMQFLFVHAYFSGLNDENVKQWKKTARKSLPKRKKILKALDKTLGKYGDPIDLAFAQAFLKSEYKVFLSQLDTEEETQMREARNKIDYFIYLVQVLNVQFQIEINDATFAQTKALQKVLRDWLRRDAFLNALSNYRQIHLKDGAFAMRGLEPLETWALKLRESTYNQILSLSHGLPQKLEFKKD